MTRTIDRYLYVCIGYIVVFKESATPAQIEEYGDLIKEDGENGLSLRVIPTISLTLTGGVIKYTYDALMKGVAATMSDSLVNSFRQDDVVDFIG